MAFSTRRNTRFLVAFNSGVIKRALIDLNTHSSVAQKARVALATVGSVGVGAGRIGSAAVGARLALVDILRAILAREGRGAVTSITAWKVFTFCVVLAERLLCSIELF